MATQKNTQRARTGNNSAKPANVLLVENVREAVSEITGGKSPDEVTPEVANAVRDKLLKLAGVETVETGTGTGTVEHDVDNAPPGKIHNMFQLEAYKATETARRKTEVLMGVRQRLAEAKDLYSEGEGRSKEASEIADKAGISLFRARAEGLLNPAELSALLVDIFGGKPDAKGRPGKTPQGAGETLRKRIVRAEAANALIETGDGGPFFKGLSPESSNDDASWSIREVVSSLHNSEISIWTAYDLFQKIKANHAERIAAAFDVKKIAAIVDGLASEGAGDVIRNSGALRAAYVALWEQLVVIGKMEEPVDIASIDVSNETAPAIAAE